MWRYPKEYDVIVVGAGHAGCEAAHASSRMGMKTLLLTMNLDTIGKLSCNPSIGGTAKGHLVREIDALGGIMGKIADRTSIQFRMLNSSKGPAVRSPRSQADKSLYSLEMKRFLESIDFLDIKQGTTESFIVENGKAVGVLTKEGIEYRGKAVVISAGTFMRGLMHIGESKSQGGRSGDHPSTGLSPCLESHGFRLGRLKTGTPPRIHRRSIDFLKCEEQPGDDDVAFSYDEREKRLPQVSCYITYTTPKTHEIIQKNLDRSPMHIGQIKGIGTRYCPSIEDKIVRFPDKIRHQIFLEPEGLNTDEFYASGISSSLPFDVQYEMIRNSIGLENAEIMRPAYAIEYDYVLSEQMYPSLETKLVENLYLAGQLNGTTGYEEAAGQGLIAGINAAAKVLGKKPFILKRSDGYLGVMIDDLIRFDLTEPYRMFTSRAEHRLLLRQDNADLRLRMKAFEYNMVSKEQYDKVKYKKETIALEVKRLEQVYTSMNGKSVSFKQVLNRPDWTYERALKEYPHKLVDHGTEINEQIETELKYAGYLMRQEKEVSKLEHLDAIKVPKELNYQTIVGLRIEARQKLIRFTPENLGQASRIPGVTFADVSVLQVAISRK